MDPHNMPPELYEWERNYLAPIDLDTPERYRQRTFSMYCYHGPFPRVLRAWAIQHELPVGLIGCDVNESFKQTGDYHIFRSAVSADGKKFAPVEIICVSFLLLLFPPRFGVFSFGRSVQVLKFHLLFVTLLLSANVELDADSSTSSR